MGHFHGRRMPLIFVLIGAAFVLEGVLLALTPVRVRASLGPVSTFGGSVGPFSASVRTPPRLPPASPGRGSARGGGITGAPREVRAFGAFIKALRRRARRPTASVRLEGGIGDPALGALLMGSAAAVLAGALTSRGTAARLRFRPDLIADEVHGRGEAEASFRLWAVVPATGAALRARRP